MLKRDIQKFLCFLGIHDWYYDYAGRKTCRICDQCDTYDGIHIIMDPNRTYADSGGWEPHCCGWDEGRKCAGELRWDDKKNR